jgi:cullin-4
MSANTGALKRKHSGKTIKELFTTQSKPNAAAAAPLSPTKKRTRRESSPTAAAEASPPPISNMSTADMYHFPSKKAEVVDITSSPDNSPAAKLNARNGMRKSGPRRTAVLAFESSRLPHWYLDSMIVSPEVPELAKAHHRPPADSHLQAR